MDLKIEFDLCDGNVEVVSVSPEMPKSFTEEAPSPNSRIRKAHLVNPA